jgi:uncharacterized protein YbaP (TraB family)
MKIATKKILPTAWILLLLCPGIWQPLNAQKNTIENALFWRISGNGVNKPSYLFGTYHLLNSGYLETIPAVENAFEHADGVVVETELDSSKMLQMMFLMVMPDKKISDLLSEEDYKLVTTEVVDATGASMDMLAQLKPTSITLILTVVYAQKENQTELNKYGGHPLDSYFATAGKKNNKTVATFESMEEQMQILFDHDPVEEQAKQLVEFIKSKDDMIKAQSDLIKMYLNQDLSGMYRLYRKYQKQFGDATYLLDDRNEKWIEKLPGYIEAGNQFIAVGAMHFTGDKGLIKLLREKGYTLTPLPLR